MIYHLLILYSEKTRSQYLLEIQSSTIRLLQSENYFIGTGSVSAAYFCQYVTLSAAKGLRRKAAGFFTLLFSCRLTRKLH
jgi:hypothetical protein